MALVFCSVGARKYACMHACPRITACLHHRKCIPTNLQINQKVSIWSSFAWKCCSVHSKCMHHRLAQKRIWRFSGGIGSIFACKKLDGWYVWKCECTFYFATKLLRHACPGIVTCLALLKVRVCMEHREAPCSHKWSCSPAVCSAIVTLVTYLSHEELDISWTCS